MSRLVVFHRLAAKDFVNARRFYIVRSMSAEARFVLGFRAAVERIARSPESGSPSIEPCRWVKVPRYPYFLHYRSLSPTLIEVVAVAHKSRRPGFWLRRTKYP